MSETAGQVQNKLLKDQTKYNALEVGHYMAEEISDLLYESAYKHHDVFAENEYCVVMVLAKDPLLKGVVRRKFYCWPYLS